MTKKINILLVEPGAAPRPAQVENTLATFEAVLGGPVELNCFLPQRVLLVSREDAKGLGLPPNRRAPRGEDYIAGTFLLCGFEDDAFQSLTPAQQMEFQTRFAAPGEFMLVGADTVCAAPERLAEETARLCAGMKAGDSVVLTKWGRPEGGAPER